MKRSKSTYAEPEAEGHEGHGQPVMLRSGRLYCPHQSHDGEWTSEGKSKPTSAFPSRKEQT